MDIILLPVLSRATSPDEALAIMKESRRSGAVVVSSPPQGIITASGARKAKNQNLKDLLNAELEPLPLLFDGDFVSEGFALLNLPHTAFATVRGHLLQTYPGMGHQPIWVAPPDLTAFERIIPAGSELGFLGYDRGAAVVLTLHEQGAAPYKGPPNDCWCTNPQTPHDFPAGQKLTGQTCDICSFAVDCS